MNIASCVHGKSYADESATAYAMNADGEDFTAQDIAYVYFFADITIEA